MNPQLGFLTLFVLFVMFHLTGCEESASEDIKTSGLYADIEVKAYDQAEATVRVDLNVGGPNGTEVELSASDELLAHANNETKTLKKTETLLNDIYYSRDFDMDASDEKFIVSLEREDDVSASNSHVTMPASFLISLPSENTRFSIDDFMDVVWNPATEIVGMQIQIFSDCHWTDESGSHDAVYSFTSTVADTGSATLALNEFDDLQEALARGSECESELRLMRESEGEIDANFEEGGEIIAQQIREQAVIITQ